MPRGASDRTVGMMARENRRTFFVESYIPKLDAASAATLSSRLRTTVEQLRKEGLPLTWIRSFALLDEDTYVWMVEAAELDHLVLIHQLAGVELDHVAEVLPGEMPAA